jgi:hypothetical protein
MHGSKDIADKNFEEAVHTLQKELFIHSISFR